MNYTNNNSLDTVDKLAGGSYKVARSCVTTTYTAANRGKRGDAVLRNHVISYLPTPNLLSENPPRLIICNFHSKETRIEDGGQPSKHASGYQRKKSLLNIIDFYE